MSRISDDAMVVVTIGDQHPDVRECVFVDGLFRYVLHSGWSIHPDDSRITNIKIGQVARNLSQTKSGVNRK